MRHAVLLGPMRLRHTSALVCFLLSGCFLGHGRDGEERPDAGARDAGPPPVADAGPGCAVEPLDAAIVECPPSTVIAGTDVGVQVSYGVARCCDLRGASASVAHDGHEHFVTAQASVCDCCDACRCSGTSTTERVSVGALEPGMHVIHAGETSCVVWAEEGMCHGIAADEVHAPTVLFPDQTLSATMLARAPGGCGCTPSAMEIPDAVQLSLCGCCEECDCIDGGYEVGYSTGPLPAGDHVLDLGGVGVNVRVVDRSACGIGSEPTGLEIVGPDPSLVQGGQRLWWAVVHGSENLCCSDPAPAFEEERAGTAIGLAVRSCAFDPCACVGTPKPYEAWHSLGELSPGTYTVRAGALAETFVVGE